VLLVGFRNMEAIDVPDYVSVGVMVAKTENSGWKRE
jgi:hypothetical protein